jgi:hypothetical protein
MLSFALLFLLSIPTTPYAGDENARCSLRVLWGGPSEEVMYVRAIATGNRIMEAVGEEVPLGRQPRPDSALAFELRVVESAGGVEAPAPGDLIRVTPWDYVADCSWRTWEGPWIAEDEETILTIRGSVLQDGGGHANVLGGSPPIRKAGGTPSGVGSTRTGARERTG